MRLAVSCNRRRAAAELAAGSQAIEIPRCENVRSTYGGRRSCGFAFGICCHVQGQMSVRQRCKRRLASALACFGSSLAHEVVDGWLWEIWGRPSVENRSSVAAQRTLLPNGVDWPDHRRQALAAPPRVVGPTCQGTWQRRARSQEPCLAMRPNADRRMRRERGCKLCVAMMPWDSVLHLECRQNAVRVRAGGTERNMCCAKARPKRLGQQRFLRNDDFLRGPRGGNRCHLSGTARAALERVKQASLASLPEITRRPRGGGHEPWPVGRGHSLRLGARLPNPPYYPCHDLEPAAPTNCPRAPLLAGTFLAFSQALLPATFHPVRLYHASTVL